MLTTYEVGQDGRSSARPTRVLRRRPVHPILAALPDTLTDEQKTEIHASPSARSIKVNAARP